MVLERLDNNEKVEFIDYYSKKLFDLTEVNSHLEDINFMKGVKFGLRENTSLSRL